MHEESHEPGNVTGNRVILQIRELAVFTSQRPLVHCASLDVPEHQVFGIIGASGCGKSTLLRSMNRLTDLAGLRVTGEILLHGISIHAPGTDVDQLRAKVGMLFQQPVVFPTTIRENVLFGARRLRAMNRSEQDDCMESALREAALWAEVKDRLKSEALKLSVGQQQRLCLARTLATRPEIILMDEPTSALDPRSTEAIEHLLLKLKGSHTLLLVTHQMEQARRVCDSLAYMKMVGGCGQMACHGDVETVLRQAESSV